MEKGRSNEKQMTSREEILSRLCHNVRETYDMPELDFPKTTFADPMAEFKHQLETSAGAKWIEIGAGDDLNAAIHSLFPDAGLISSNVAGVRADLNPDTVESAAELDKTDIGVVNGGVCCAENACIWVPMDMKQKSVCFMAERLFIIIDKSSVVNNMHEAYAVLASMKQTSKYGFGCFISGPSKTADIEQALVYGAQAAKELAVIIR